METDTKLRKGDYKNDWPRLKKRWKHFKKNKYAALFSLSEIVHGHLLGTRDYYLNHLYYRLNQAYEARRNLGADRHDGTPDKGTNSENRKRKRTTDDPETETEDSDSDFALRGPWAGHKLVFLDETTDDELTDNEQSTHDEHSIQKIKEKEDASAPPASKLYCIRCRKTNMACNKAIPGCSKCQE